jgi:hypothetical protein
MLEDVRIYMFLNSQPNRTEYNRLWLEVFRLFTAVKNLYLPSETSPCVSSALHDLVEKGRTTEVLPALRKIILEGLDWERMARIRDKIEQFVAARRVAGHTIAISGLDLPMC